MGLDRQAVSKDRAGREAETEPDLGRMERELVTAISPHNRRSNWKSSRGQMTGVVMKSVV